jgi:hypothetical protein
VSNKIFDRGDYWFKCWLACTLEKRAIRERDRWYEGTLHRRIVELEQQLPGAAKPVANTWTPTSRFLS